VSKRLWPFFIHYVRNRNPDYGSRDQDGFTLLEMIVVLAIIALIAGLIVPSVIGRPDEARVTVTRADLRAISNALELYRLDNQVYPTTEQGLAALVNRPSLSPVPPNWHSEGYLAQAPVDPWGNPYMYRQPGQHGRYDLMSYGSDGKPGGDGNAADITNWTP
jgi:general secretion pathway protein G